MSSMQKSVKLSKFLNGQKAEVAQSEGKTEKSLRSQLCHIVEEGVDAAAAEEIQKQIVGPEDKFLHHFLKRKHYSASQCAKPRSPTSDGPDLPGEVQMDRLSTSAVWPDTMQLIPDAWPYRIRFQEVQELQLRLDGVARLKSGEIQDRYLRTAATAMGPGGKPSKPGQARTDESNLDEPDSIAFHEFREELEIERAMRILNAEQMPQHLPVADEQLQSFKSIFSTLRKIADDAREKISSGQGVNEAEYRHFWDRVMSAVFSPKTLDDGTSIESSTRNVLWDLTSELSDTEFTNTVDNFRVDTLKFPKASDIAEPVASNTSVCTGTMDATLQDAYCISSKEAADSLRKMVVARRNELLDSASRWSESTRSNAQLQARVVDYHDTSICDGVVVAVVPEIFPSKEREHAKMFSPLCGFHDKPSEKAMAAEPEQPPDVHADPDPQRTIPVLARKPIPNPLQATRAAKAKIRVQIIKRQNDSPAAGSKVSQGSSFSATSSPALESPVLPDASVRATSKAKPSPGAVKQNIRGSSSERTRRIERLLPIILVLLFLEYKKGLESPIQGINQAIHYLIDGVYNLNAAGIHDFPIFAIAAVGARGRLLAAWGEYETIEVGFAKRSVFVTRLADTNCPEWDISDRCELFRLALFLIHLRDHWSKRLVEKFDRTSFREEWTKMDFSEKKLSGRFAWRTADQKGEDAYIKLKQEIDNEIEAAARRKNDLLEQAKERAKAEEEKKDARRKEE
ncbi:hypothetical protein HDZ31DRAFT_60463 [Schizophyllum fasciatum]